MNNISIISIIYNGCEKISGHGRVIGNKILSLHLLQSRLIELILQRVWPICWHIEDMQAPLLLLANYSN